VKKFLILTAGYGEGHNSAARGLRDGLARVAPDAAVDLRDLFAENFGRFHEIVRRSYATLINRWPRAWGWVYAWLEQKKDFGRDFARFGRLKRRLGRLLDDFQPDAVLSVFPAYPHLLNQIAGSHSRYQNIVVVTDSITVNAIWYRTRADYFLVPNEQSAEVVRAAGIPGSLIKTFGFPVNPAFADLAPDRTQPLPEKPRVLYMINAGTRAAPAIVQRLLDLPIDLTVTVGRDEKLRRVIEEISTNRKIEIVGWTDQMPRLLCESHLLIGKAGGATVQETIAARCPMIISHVVSGQEEGNARLIAETNSGIVALSPDQVIAAVARAFADDGRVWREWVTNITRLSRPRAALEIAEFLLAL
jgi:processive 1,2-diacylglycerol beta-glucosyltransferase